MIKTHAELILNNLSKNLAALPEEDEFLKWGMTQEQIQRYKELHSLFKNIYDSIGSNPTTYGLPNDNIRNDSSDNKNRQKAYIKIRSIISFLTGIGLLGVYDEALKLNIDIEQLQAWCADNKIGSLKKLQEIFEKLGFEFAESSSRLSTSYNSNPQILKALSEYTCAIKNTKSNALFERCDFRVFSKEKWSFNKYDALNSLSSDKRDILSKFIACIEEYNHKMELKLTFLLRGFWTCNYVDKRTKKSTCGYWIENDAVSLKVNFDDITSIIPFVNGLPEDFQAKFFDGCPCLKCRRGNCDGDGVISDLNGKLYYLCKQPWYLYENIEEKHLTHMISLLRERMKQLNIVK